MVDLYKFPHEYSYPNYTKVKDHKFYERIEEEFKKRVLDYNLISKKFLKQSFKTFLSNVDYIKQNINQNNYVPDSKRDQKQNRKSFLGRNPSLNGEKNIIKNFKINDKKVYLDLEDDRTIETNMTGLSKILSRKKLNNKRYLFLPEKYSLQNKEKLIKKFIPQLLSEIIYPSNVQIIFENNDLRDKLIIVQSSPKQTVLINGGELNNLDIVFKGINSKSKDEFEKQRFNERGLTGCLNIYNAKLKDISITVEGGKCEDSLNLISSTGSLEEVKIQNSYQDAIDLDFSDININKIKINNAGNDCLDVSAGNYLVNYSILKNCSDKAISIGEKSSFTANKIMISNSNIGIAVKDLSLFNSEDIIIDNTPICIEIFQKKQEFGGAYADVKNIKCTGNYISDNKSVFYNR